MNKHHEGSVIDLKIRPTTNQTDMMKDEIIRPLLAGLHGLFEYLTAKAIILATSWPVLLSLELFETPREWWAGLIYLVIFDWLAGVARAIYRRNFDVRVAVKKWYCVVVYMIVCGSVAIVSNTFDILYYFQYLVYLTFYLKEFVSILKTFRLLAVFKVAWKIVYERDFSPESVSTFMEEVDKRHDSENGKLVN